MNKVSLFSGIGGDDLASEWAGIKTICFVENNKYCQQVLKKHWPGIPIIGDVHDVTKEKVKELTGYEWIDIISGGVPCQPASIAGQRRGKADDRWLWDEAIRVVAEFKPSWVLFENPLGIVTLDEFQSLSDLEDTKIAQILDSYAGIFDDICASIEEVGYEVQPIVIPACAVNAPHRRDRVYIIAHSKQLRTRGRDNGDAGRGESTLQIERPDSGVTSHAQGRERLQGHQDVAEFGRRQARQVNSRGVISNPHPISTRLEKREEQDLLEQFSTAKRDNQSFADTYSKWQSQSKRCINKVWGRDSYIGWEANWIEVATAFCGMDDGLPDRVARLKAIGNAQAPQQIYPIYKAIVEIDSMIIKEAK